MIVRESLASFTREAPSVSGLGLGKTALFPKVIDEIMYDVLKDEDTNRPQYLVCKLLSGGHQNICVVGDDAQSIYKWRGAEIRNILEFKKDFPDTRVVRLERNYRSTKNILAAADSVIKFNRNQLDKSLWTDNPEGDKINIIECRDDIDEADYIISKIKKFKDTSNYDVKDCAVLYRTNAQSLTFENACRIL